MKFEILLSMLFDLLAKHKLTATYFAERYEISPRTVYRYVDILSMVLPVYVKRGRDGGICISDSYKLPKGFMEGFKKIKSNLKDTAFKYIKAYLFLIFITCFYAEHHIFHKWNCSLFCRKWFVVIIPSAISFFSSCPVCCV